VLFTFLIAMEGRLSNDFSPMPATIGLRNDELDLAHKCLDQDPAALALFRDNHLNGLCLGLIHRGASASEAEELAAELFGDCVVGRDGKPPLLEKFDARSSLQSWLFRVAVNRWIDGKRRDKFRGEPPRPAPEDSSTDFYARIPAEPSADRDPGLLRFLRGVLRSAFNRSDDETLLMLRLVYLHGLTQREIGRMWGCSEATVSRQLAGALEQIETRTLQQLQQWDPLLKLSWQDFLDLCETKQLDFL
jgi:RNA polymerase sigma factor (sigma-70 family)